MYEIKICLWNLDDCKNRVENFEWFTLPQDEVKMKDWIKDLNTKGKEEIFIYDSDEHNFIDKDTNIEALIALSKEYVDEIIDLSGKDPVFHMRNFNEMLNRYEPKDIVSMITFGKFNISDDYFKFDENGNIETLNTSEYEDYREKAFYKGVKEFLRNFKDSSFVRKFTSKIYLQNEDISHFYVIVKCEFEIPYIEDALLYYDTDEDELQEMFDDETFLEEDFSRKYEINIINIEYLNWDNYN